MIKLKGYVSTSNLVILINENNKNNLRSYWRSCLVLFFFVYLFFYCWKYVIPCYIYNAKISDGDHDATDTSGCELFSGAASKEVKKNNANTNERKSPKDIMYSNKIYAVTWVPEPFYFPAAEFIIQPWI